MIKRAREEKRERGNEQPSTHTKNEESTLGAVVGGGGGGWDRGHREKSKKRTHAVN